MAKGAQVQEDDDELGEGSSLATKMGGMLSGAGSGAGPSTFMADLGGVDLTKASSGFELLPENVDLIFDIVKVVAGESAAKNKQLILTLQDTESKNKVNDYVVYVGDNPWKFKSLCQATDMLSEDGSAFIGSSEQDFRGQQIVARVQHDTYQGQKRNKIKGGYKSVESLDGTASQAPGRDGAEPDFS